MATQSTTNKRILIVDDTPYLLEAHACMIQGDEDCWEVKTANGGQEALELMEEAPFDVVVSDLEMPEMDGIELIGEVKARYPHTARVILSGVNDQERVVNALRDTHQFLSKPIDAKTLKAVLTRICALDTYLKNESLQTLVARLGELPSFPTVYMEIVKELDSDEPSVEKVAEIVSRDPGMMAKMLQIANSAAFGLGQEVTDMAMAVGYLGMSTVRSLALSAHIFAHSEKRSPKGISPTALWDHGLKSAMLARMILRRGQAASAEAGDAYTAATLHDIGKLLLACGAPEQFQHAAEMRSGEASGACQVEQEVFGADHAGVGAYLLGLWGLPARIVEAVAFHHVPTLSDARVVGPLSAVHIANALEHELSATPASSPGAELDMQYLEDLRLVDQLPTFRQQAEKLVGTG